MACGQHTVLVDLELRWQIALKCLHREVDNKLHLVKCIGLSRVLLRWAAAAVRYASSNLKCIALAASLSRGRPAKRSLLARVRSCQSRQNKHCILRVSRK
eukprot:2890890-Amphidinium_carterae.4